MLSRINLVFLALVFNSFSPHSIYGSYKETEEQQKESNWTEKIIIAGAIGLGGGVVQLTRMEIGPNAEMNRLMGQATAFIAHKLDAQIQEKVDIVVAEFEAMTPEARAFLKELTFQVHGVEGASRVRE